MREFVDIEDNVVQIEAIFDPATANVTYIVWLAKTKDAVIIDSVLDYDPIGSRVSFGSIETIMAYVESNSLNVHLILETHAHADHLSGSQVLKERLPAAKVAISERIKEVQEIFKGVFDLPSDFPVDGSQFDILFEGHSLLKAGELSIKVLPTPGHTPACSSFLIEDAVFTGDAIFMPDVGTGRCDFPGGSAKSLYTSVTKELFSLPESTRVFVGHDYPPETRDVAWESTIGEQKANNHQLTAATSEADYLQFRNKRDSGLSAPKLLFQSVQINIDAGRFPKPGSNEKHYLKIPLNVTT